MTFEEKLAVKGRKMDEAKAKLDEAINARKLEHQKNREQLAADIAALDAAIEEFDAKLDAEIDKQIDAVGVQIDKQAQDLDAALSRAEEKIENDATKVKAAFTLDKATAEDIANEPTRIEEIQKNTAAQVARAKGDVAAAEENARLLREQRDSKCNSVKLRAQMRVNDAKAKIADRREAIDKAAEEEWILDLLDYAESCYEMAYAWAMEAEYTLMEAAYEIDYYTDRFC